MPRQNPPAAKGSSAGPQGGGPPRRRSGQGASSALSEMLRRQAQDPRPGAVQPPGDRDTEGQGEPRPAAQRRHRS